MDKELLHRISRFAKMDQRMRNSELNNSELLGKLYGYIIYLIDSIHNRRIHKLIRRSGYPSQGLIGKRGMRDFWLLVQHQDFDIELQKACLKHCDFEPKEKTYLTDRILVNTGENHSI